jgi:hypothetical protein
MLRNTWDIEQYAQHHISALTAEMHQRQQARQATHTSPGLLLHLRQRAGLALIQAGHALAGPEARRPDRPAAMRLAG